MWKQLTEALWRILKLTEESERNRQNLKELEKQYRDFAAATERKFDDLRFANERLSNEVQRLSDEIKRQREHYEAERKILKLELENYLLRQQHSLPSFESKQLSKPKTDEPPNEEEKAET